MKKSTSAAMYLILCVVCVFLDVSYAYPQSRDLARFEQAKSYFRQGVTYFNTMQYLASVEFFRKAVSHYPDYYTAREYLARAYRLAGFKDEALAEWEYLASVNENNVMVQSKVDSLRFRDGYQAGPVSFGEFVLSQEFVSSDMKRYRFPAPTDVAVDDDKNVYLTSFSTGKLIKFDPNREGLAVYSPTLNGKLYGIDYYNKKLAVSDFKNDAVYIMNTIPKVLSEFGSSGSGEGQFHGPEGVCFGRDGSIYVVDSGNHRVQKFDAGGRYILTIGSPGEYEGQLRNPTDCAVDGATVYVTDSGNNRIACFDDSGNFLKNISVQNSRQLRSVGVYNGNLLLSDEYAGCMMYDMHSESAQAFKTWENGNRKFARLFSACVDRDNYLYCLDYNMERLLVFSTIQQRYTNFDVNITSVDTGKYPVTAFYMTVRDRSGAPVYGLTRDNFSITEDGARISGIYTDYLRDLHASSSIVLCVDRSNKMRAYHNDVPWAAEFILKKMRKNDRLKVAGFNSDYRIDNDFDWSRRRALRALKKYDYDEGRNVGKALYNSLSELLPKTNRRAIVLISDGSADGSSFTQYTPKNIIEYARGHCIPIYVISFRGKSAILEKIARDTGGDIIMASEMDSLRGIYDRIRNAEEYRYVLVYSTFKAPSLKGWWSDVKIEVNYKGQKGLEWGGYFVP